MAGEVTTVLNPTALRTDDIASPGPDAGLLAGKTVGFRIDIMWRSWDWVSDEWAEAFRRAGADVVFWRAGGRTGPEGERMDRELRAFLNDIDVAVVGLGNCGSCTGWTIHDAVAAAAAGLPTVAVTTANFEMLGKNLARRAGRSGLRVHVLPYPLNEQFEDDVRAIARSHIPLVMRTLGGEATLKSTPPQNVQQKETVR